MDPVASRLGEISTDEEALLRRKERLLQIIVSERSSDPALRDDLLQEARIRLLEVSRAKPDKGEAYWHKAVGYRVREVAGRKNWTGKVGHRGWEDAMGASKKYDSLHRPISSGGDGEVELGETLAIEDVLAPLALEKVEVSYHDGEIAQAISSLSPRQRAYVMQRFWGGRTHSEIGAEVGQSPNELSNEWITVIKPMLEEALQGLGGLVRTG